MDLYGLHGYTIILLLSTLSLVAGSNVDCNGKAFHCVNTTHFKICVDLGGGVSTTVDEFLVPCPRNTVCQQYNLFECEFELTTTPLPPTTQSEVTNEQFITRDNVWEQLDVTTLFPIKQPQGMELSEKYYNALNITPEGSMTNFLSNADKNPVSDNINNLLSGSNIDNNKTLNISRSFDKELTSSATGSGITVTQTTPYNNDLLVTNIETHSTTQDRRSQTNLLKTESFISLNKNSLDLNTRLTAAKIMNEVSGVSELLSETVTLLPDNSNKSLQQNTSRTININKQFDNTSQGRNLDILIRYNTNQLNNSDNAQYHSTNSSTYSSNTNADINNFETTTSNLFVDRIFSRDDINKKSNVSSVITSDASLQHFEPVNTEIILGTTKELGASISSNITDAIVTFLNAGLNTNVKEIGVIDDNITISTSIISETTTVKTNEIANQFTNSGLNYSEFSVALTNPFLEGNNTTLSDKSPTSETKSSKNNANEILKSIDGNITTQLNKINILQYLTSTKQYLANARNDTFSTTTSTSEIITSKNMSEILNLTSKEVSQDNNLSQISVVNTMRNVSADTDAPDEIHANLNYFDDLRSTKKAKNHSNPSLLLFNNSLITNINKPVLTTVDMATETQVASFILFNESMTAENPKEYSTTISALSLNTSPLTKVASQYTISNKRVDGVTSTAVNMFQVLRKGDVTTETLGDLTVFDESITENPNNYSTPSTLNVLEQLVSTKNPKHESDLKSSLLINKSEISKSDIISPNYNTKLNVITNNGSNIVDTVPTLTTKIIFSSDHSTIFTGRTTDEIKSITNESYVLKKNKNITWTELVIVTVATDLADSKIVTNSELDSNVKAEMYNGITTLKPIPHLVLKNETWPVMRTVAIDLENNNITTTKTRNNVTAAFSNGLKSLKSISDSISTTSKIQPTLLESLTATDSIYKENIGTTSTILNNNQSFNESTTSYLTKIPDYILKNKQVDTIDSTRLITSTVINDLERDTASITSLPATLDKPTILTDRISMTFSYSESDNDVTTKSIINSLYRENQLNPISTLINKVSDVNKIKKESFTDYTMVKPIMNTTVSINSMDLTNNTIAVIDLLSEHGLEKNKSRENKLIIESTMTTNPLTYYDSNITKSKQVTPPGTVTTRYSQFDKQNVNRKQINYEYTYVDDHKNENVNLNSTERQFENIQKLITTDNFTSLIDLNIDKTNTSLRDIEGNHNLVTNNFMQNSVKIDVTNMNNTYLNYTNKNIMVPTTILPTNSNSESMPLRNLHNSKNLSSTDIYKISENYFPKNLTTINTFSKTSAPNKYNETDHKKSNQTNENVQAPAHVINSTVVEHKGNKTEYLLNNLDIQVTPSKGLNDSNFKEISYNDVIMKNITSADKNTAQKNIYDIKSSGFNKNNVTNNKSANVKTNRSELTDYNQISEIPNSEHSKNALKSILIVQEPLEEVNHTNLHTESGSMSLIPEYEFKRYASDAMKNSTINKSNNVNRSKFIAPAKNKTISNNFYEDIINSSGIVNPPLEANTTAPTNTLTYSRNASDIKSIKIIRSNEKYTNDSNTTNKWLKNTPSEINSVQNKTHHATSTTALHFFTIMPSKLDRSSITNEPLNILKLTTIIVSNITKLELNNTQDVIRIFDHTNRSNGNDKKEPRHRQGHSESLQVGNVVTKYKTLQSQKGFKTTTDKNFSDSKYTNLITNEEFRCSKRGKYSHPNNCNNFFICIGRVQPIVGVCPTDTVFSKFLKQCTKNVTHCIRNNQFKCTAAGRFINILSNNSYFICARNKSGFIRFTLKCQKGHYLNKNNIECTPELINVSKSDENSSSTKELSIGRYKEIEGLSVNSPNYFKCEKEGKFNDPLDCKKYFVCTKGRKAVFRRKIRKCDSDEVFHRTKKKCVDEESYECDI